MVGNFQDPPLQVGLPYTGTFTEDNGIYCMNRRIFWGWLLEQLQVVNQMMELVPGVPDVTYNKDADSDFPWSVGIRLFVGNLSVAASDYVFKQSNEGDKWSWDGRERYEESTTYGSDDQERVRETGKICTNLSSIITVRLMRFKSSQLELSMV